MKVLFIVFSIIIVPIFIFLIINPNGVDNKKWTGKLVYLLLFIGTLYVTLYSRF